jgi:hypothetical protein
LENVWKMIDCALPSMLPPPSPCSTRAKMSIGRLVARPHRIDASVKAMSEKMKYVFRPK